MQTTNRLKDMPITFFAMVMGLAGLTIAWEKASEIYHFSNAIYSTLLIQSIIVFVILSVLYLYKGIQFRQAVTQEWSNPVKMNFVPAISISLLLFAVAFLPVSSSISLPFWALGSILHLVISLHVVNAWLHQEHFEIHHMNPAWFIPAVGNVIVPLAGVPLGYAAISWFFFSIGMVFWIVLMVIVFYRIIFHHPMPDKLLPTLFILIAPPSVGFLSYLKLTGSLDTFALVLYNFALFLTLLLLIELPRFARLPFFMSWWAYSFPLAAMSVASMVMAHISSQAFFGYIGLGLLFALSLLVVVLFIKTLKAIQKGAICVPEA
jgi:tellurite resistance protein